MTFTNELTYPLIAKKVWTDDGGFVTSHGEVKVALFTTDADGKLTFVPDSLRTLNAANQWTYEYRVAVLANYTLREVVVNGDTVTPVDEGGLIEIGGEKTVRSGGETVTDTYIVSYSSESGTDPQNKNKEYRIDTVTNTMPKLTVLKADLVDQTRLLPGIKFQLLDSEENALVIDGVTDENGMVTTGDDGIILNKLYFSNGTYYLKEIEVPNGYNTLDHLIQFTVGKAADSTLPFQLENNEAFATEITLVVPSSNSGENGGGEETSNEIVYSFKVLNEPGTLLPSTGGIGTTGFTLGGAALIFAALTLAFISRRRRDNEA